MLIYNTTNFGLTEASVTQNSADKEILFDNAASKTDGK